MYLKEQFGLRGQREALLLIDLGVLKSEGEFLRISEGTRKLKISKTQTLSMLPEVSKLYAKADHSFNACALEIEAVNRQGYARLLDAFEDFLKKTSKILEEDKGTIPVVIAGFMDSFTTQPFFEGDNYENFN